MATVECMVDVLGPCRLCSSLGDYRDDRCQCSRCSMGHLLKMVRARLLSDCAFDIFSACGGPGLCPLLEVTSYVNKVLHDYPLELVASGCGDVLELSTVLSRQCRKASDRGGPASLPAALAFALLRWHRCVQEFRFEFEGSQCLCHELMAAVTSSPGLTCLHLRMLGLAKDGIIMVPHLPPLISRLHLCCMRLCMEGELFRPPSFIDRLTELTLDMLNCVDEKFSTLLMEKLQGSSLKKFSLRNSRVGFKSIQILANIIAKPECVLASLVLWNCDLSCAAMQPLWKALMVNSSISLLDFCCNQILDEGIMQLCNALCRSSRAIQRLLLAAVGIASAETCQAIGEMLVACRSLKYLDLSENAIDDKGMAAIAAGIGQSHSLETVLLLNAMGFGAVGVCALADCVLRSANPPQIKLGCIKVNGQEAAKLRTTLAIKPAAWQRIEVFWDIQSIADFAGVVKQCGRLEEVYIPSARRLLILDGRVGWELRVQAAIEHLIEALTLMDNVISLTVTNCALVGNAEVVSKYLAQTKKLQRLKFVYGNMSGWNIPAFMKALSSNESVVELDFGDCRMMSCPELAAALCHNRTLESFVCYDLEVQDSGFLELMTSLSLFRMQTGMRRVPYDSFHLYECIRANWRSVLDAATFVLGGASADVGASGSRRRAAAFEKVRHSAELRSQIASRASLGKTEIQRRIGVAERFRRRAFFRLTQVVSRELACTPALDSKPQLDQLGEPILSWICAHLSVADVRAV